MVKKPMFVLETYLGLDGKDIPTFLCVACHHRADLHRLRVTPRGIAAHCDLIAKADCFVIANEQEFLELRSWPRERGTVTVYRKDDP